MAGYSKGIVDTRKLNKNNKAKLGRGGDTKIREVDNRESHVSALEAYLIDVNGKAGEEYAKRVGAGTINPLTGMPEYRTRQDEEGNEIIKMTGDGGSTTTIDSSVFDPVSNWGEQKSYTELAGMELGDMGSYLEQFGLGESYIKYLTPFTDKPVGFLGEEQDLAMRALGRTAGRGLGQAAGARDIAASRSGLATSGTITQGYETQKKELFQDYAAGKEGIGLDFRQAEYQEQQRQLEKFYTDIGMVKQFKQ